MKLTVLRLKELMLEEFNSIREGMDTLSKMAADRKYRPIDDVPRGTPAHPSEPPAMNPHQAEHDRKMKEDPSYREWFMSQAQPQPDAEDLSDFSQRLKDIGAI